MTANEMRLVSAVKDFFKIRSFINTWMEEERNAGRLRQNGDCPRWLEYEDAEKEMFTAINLVGAE